MVSILKIVGLLSWVFLLCLGLSCEAQAGNAEQASHPASVAGPTVSKGGQAGVSGERNKLKGGHRIEGEVLRVEGKNYFVMGQDGQEIRLYRDKTTRTIGNISQGNRIVAAVNSQNYVQSIRLADMEDIRAR